MFKSFLSSKSLVMLFMVFTVAWISFTSSEAMDPPKKEGATSPASESKDLAKALNGGINFFIHYKPQPWSTRLLILQQIKEQLRAKNIPDDVMQTYLATPTELHFTLGWGRILPVHCISDFDCKFVPMPKDVLKDIYQAFNDIRNKDGFDINHAYREFRSLFHQGSRLYLFESYPLADWHEDQLIYLINVLKLIFKKFMGESFGELIDYENPDGLTKFEIVGELHKVMGQFNQRVVENTTHYDVSLVQDVLLTIAQEKVINVTSEEGEVIDFCNSFIEDKIEQQLKNSRVIGEAVSAVKTTLESTLQFLFHRTTFRKYYYDARSQQTKFDSVPLDTFIHWDLIGVRDDEKIDKAKGQCIIFINKARENGLITFYNDFKRKFVHNFAETSLKVMGSPQQFSYDNKIISVLQVKKATELELRKRYIEFLRNYLTEKYLPTEEIPSEKISSEEIPSLDDSSTADLGLNYIGKSINWDKKVCPYESNPQQCFMIVAEKAYYNGQSHFKYHMTLLNKTLTGLREDVRNNSLLNLEKTLLGLHGLDSIEGSIDELNLEAAYIRFFDHKVIQTKVMGPDIPRHNEEIIADKVLVKLEGESSLIPLNKSDALDLAHEKGMDLVEISANTYPPICEIVNFGEYMQKKREETSQRKSTRAPLTFDMNVEDGDLPEDLSTQMSTDSNSETLLNLQQILKESKEGVDVYLEFPSSMSEEDAENAAKKKNNQEIVRKFFSTMKGWKVLRVGAYQRQELLDDKMITIHGIKLHLQPVIGSDSSADYITLDPIEVTFIGKEVSKAKGQFSNDLFVTQIKPLLEKNDKPLIINIVIYMQDAGIEKFGSKIGFEVLKKLKVLGREYNLTFGQGGKVSTELADDGITKKILYKFTITRGPKKD